MRQLPTEITAILIASFLLISCAGAPRAARQPREASRPAAAGTYPGLEDALAGAWLDPRGPLLDAAQLRARVPALDTRGLPWFKGLNGEAMHGPRFGADLVPALSLGTSSSEGAGIMFNNGGTDDYVGPSPGAGDGASWGEDRGVGVDVQ